MIRLYAVCAVLLGLFFMHGAPGSAANGCHGAASMRAAAMPAGVMPASAMPASAMAGSAAFAADHADTARAAEQMCLGTPARDAVSPAAFGAALTAAVVDAGPAGGLLRRTAGRADRAPPVSGRGLLLRIRIARM